MTLSNVLPEIADRYGISVKTLHNRIREHPELGIVVEPKKAPNLTDNQVQGLCAILDDRYGKTPKIPEEHASGKREFAELSQSFSDLQTKYAQVTTDLAVEIERRKGIEAQLSLMLELNNKIPKLEQAAEDRQREIGDLRAELAEAHAQAASARDEWKKKGLWDRILRR